MTTAAIRCWRLVRASSDQLSHDERVASAARDYAREHGMPREVAQAKATAYARESVPAFNAYVYFRVGY